MSTAPMVHETQGPTPLHPDVVARLKQLDTQIAAIEQQHTEACAGRDGRADAPRA